MGLFDKIELPDVKHKIVVASGKGGVGKSFDDLVTNIMKGLHEDHKPSP